MARTASQMPECWGAVPGGAPGGLHPEVFLHHVHAIACVPAAACMTRSINIFLDGPSPRCPKCHRCLRFAAGISVRVRYSARQ
eukprot:9213816-Pyramimonas_sp.AAC.1